jgi:hypothetical protein
MHQTTIDQFKKTLDDKVAQKVGKEETATSKDHAERSKKLRRSLSTAKVSKSSGIPDNKNPFSESDRRGTHDYNEFSPGANIDEYFARTITFFIEGWGDG